MNKVVGVPLTEKFKDWGILYKWLVPFDKESVPLQTSQKEALEKVYDQILFLRDHSFDSDKQNLRGLKRFFRPR